MSDHEEDLPEILTPPSTDFDNLSFYDLYETDKAKEQHGVPLYFADAKLRITLARAGGGNAKFARCLTVHSKPYKRAIQTGQLSDDKANDLMMKTYAEAAILNWETLIRKDKGLCYVKGIKLKDMPGLQPVTPENIVKVLRIVPDLFREIMTEATNIDNYTIYTREEDSKN